MTNMVVGRIGTKISKSLLYGEEVVLINCEKAVFTGSKSNVLAKYKTNRERGVPLKGPYFPRRPDMFVRRVLRGMLPYKTLRGKEAFKRLKCYIGSPEEFKDKELTSFDEFHKDQKLTRTVSVLEICRHLGFDKL